MKLVERARRLRKDSTDAENRLWSHLRAHRYGGHKFKRQQPIGPYIVDFVCFDARVIIEVDGGQHADAARSDSIRDAWLAREGFRDLRFWNSEVLENTEGVMQRITSALRAPSPQPSPTGGEGGR
jgi:very-short-patch-repair endonuclease